MAIAALLVGLAPCLLPSSSSSLPLQRIRSGHRSPIMCTTSDLLELTQPTQAQNEEMGVRDWPSTVVRGSLDDECDEGAMRYVLEGTGQINCARESVQVQPNTLVRVSKAATLQWLADEGELVILSPEYKGPPLLPIAGALFLTFAALIVVSSG